MKIRIDQVILEKRTRSLDEMDVDSLVESIKKDGLIHPILLDSELKLLVGGRRLSALTLAGIIELEEGVHFRIQPTPLSTVERLSIELSENIERTNFSLQEEVGLREKIHLLGINIAEEKGEDWNTDKSAALLGITPRQLTRDLKVAKEIRLDPELAKEKDKSIILSRIKKKEETSRRMMLAGVASGGEVSGRVIHGDALTEMKKLKDGEVDLMLVDPPFGTELPDRNHWVQKYSNIYGGFSDTKDDALILLEGVLMEAKRVLKVGCYCWVFYSSKYNNEIEGIIQRTLGGYQPVPGIWRKSGNHNFQPFERQTINYEPYYMCWNFSKQRSLQISINCVNDFPTVQNKIHPTEKPLELYKFLIQASSVEREIVLDPFAGSGSSGQSALELNRNFIGIEHSEEMVGLISQRLAKKGGD